MANDDIFNLGNQDLGTFFSFKAVGDQISGTYVDLMEAQDGYGNDQYVVVLKSGSDKHRVGIKKTHTFLVDQLSKVRLGQIIGFRFMKELDSKNGGAKTKVINLFQNPSMVDDAWIQEHSATLASYGETVSSDSFIPSQFKVGSQAQVTTPQPTVVPVTATPVVAAVPTAPVTGETAPAAENPVFGTIRMLAVSKGVATAGMPNADVDRLIEGIAGVPMTEENTSVIIAKLSSIF